MGSSQQRIVRSAPVLLEMFDVFEQRAGVDSSVVRGLRRGWIRRFIRSLRTHDVFDPEVRQLVNALLLLQPGVVMTAMISWPRFATRRVVRTAWESWVGTRFEITHCA